MALKTRAELTAEDKSPIVARARPLVSADVVAALAEARTEPRPLWLCTHLWRNGVSLAMSMFMLHAGLAADLRQYAADMRELFLSPRPDSLALTRVMQRLVRPDGYPRLSHAAAAGPLPDTYEMGFVVLAPEAVADKHLLGEKTVIYDSFTFPFCTAGFMAPLVALQEQRFLPPADSVLPHFIRICDITTADGLKYVPATALSVDTTPCDTCGGSMSSKLYYRDSPTWQALRRTMRTCGVTPGSTAARGIALAPRKACSSASAALAACAA
jgi:hypothetical protein